MNISQLVPTTENIKTVTDLREDPVALLDLVEKKRQPVYIFHRSQPRALIVSINDFIENWQLKKDALDLEEAIVTSIGEFVGFDKLDHELRKKHGLPSYRRKKS